MSDLTLDYARPARWNWSSLAILGMIWAIASPAVSIAALVIGGPRSGALLPHFVCCEQKIVGAVVFEFLPAVSCVLGAIALLRIWSWQSGTKGIWLSVLAIIFGVWATFFRHGALGLIRD
jgi:hypothetical protein